MALLQRVGQLISNDLGALLPGTGIALDRAALLRLLLYLCLFILAVRLFLPVMTMRPDPQLRPVQPLQPEFNRGNQNSVPTQDEVQEI